MHSHLNLPYNWMDCVKPETCPEHIHLEETAENLNSYPVSWVETLIGNCSVTETKIHFYNSAGEKHNQYGPAVIKSDGTLKWYLNGKCHRLNGPARIRNDGAQEWWNNGQQHRDDGPAIECADGRKEWWRNGFIHREDGPAIIRANGTQEWFLNGEYHREDGPAIIWAWGTKEWWINGVPQPNPETYKEGSE